MLAPAMTSSSNIFRHARYDIICCLWMPYRQNSTLNFFSTRWIHRNDPYPQSFISLDDYNEVKEALNVLSVYTGFACSIKNNNRTNQSKKNQETGFITLFSLRFACVRKNAATSKGRRQSSSKMTGCEWGGLAVTT